MEQHNEQFETRQDPRHRYALIRPLAPEDIVPGMYVAIVRIVVERWPSSFCEDGSWSKPPVLHESVPAYAGMPLRVVGVCLPFVMTQRPDGAHWTADLRRHRLGLLSDRYGAESYRRYAADAARGAQKENDDADDDD